MKKRILSIIALCTMIVSCDKTLLPLLLEEHRDWWVPSYIDLDYSKEPHISVCDGISITLGHDTYAKRYKKPQNENEQLLTTRHLELSQVHGDISFSGRATKQQYIGFDVYCWAFPLVIDVVCDTDYDAVHPAGSSLADVITIEYLQYRDYVANNYKTDKGLSYDVTRDAGVKESKLISELTNEDFRLMQGCFTINPAQAPTTEEVLTLTFSVKKDGAATRPYTFDIKVTYSPEGGYFRLVK